MPDRYIETIEGGNYSNSPDIFDIVYPKRFPVYSDTDTDGEECELDDAHLPPRECVRPKEIHNENVKKLVPDTEDISDSDECEETITCCECNFGAHPFLLIIAPDDVTC